jgi:hypothetical protein
MAINSGYYLQIIKTSFIIRDAIIRHFDRSNECFEEFDEVRLLYEKIHKNVDNLRLRKVLKEEEEKEKLKMNCDDLRRICREFEIQIQINKKGTESWKREIYANFFICGQDITDLIIINKKKEKKTTSSTQDLEL